MTGATFDIDAYVRRSRSGPCFVCEFLRGNPDYAHHTVWQDEGTVVFLNRYPTLRGYCLVAPKAHCEDLAAQPQADYLALQAVVHRVARALKQAFDAERIYVLSLGSRQGNRHLHWHVAPLPKGVPYERQQYRALMAENGVLAIAEAEMAATARRIADALASEGA